MNAINQTYINALLDGASDADPSQGMIQSDMANKLTHPGVAVRVRPAITRNERLNCQRQAVTLIAG